MSTPVAETKIEVADLIAQPKSTRARMLAREARSLAARGADVPNFTPHLWPVCSLCGLPSLPDTDAKSVCCEGLLRLHGWAK